MKHNSIHVVQGVIAFTQHRDRELIENSLVKSLHELLPTEEISIYCVQNMKDHGQLGLRVRIDAAGTLTHTVDDGAALPADLSEGIRACLNNGIEPQMVKVREGFGHAVYPLVHRSEDPPGLLVITGNYALYDRKGLIPGMLRIYQNFMMLLNEGQRDKQTGLLNRQTFDNEIMRIISQPARPSSQVSLYPGTSRRAPDEICVHYLAMLDIDKFKLINDQYGHVYGDEVLLLLARLMKETFRRNDILFRYGGEEFIVVLRVPSREAADCALERFRKTVEKYPFPQVGQVTVSIGHIEMKRDQAPVALIGRADKALYYAKQNGRNRVCSYEDLVAKGELGAVEEKTGDVELF